MRRKKWLGYFQTTPHLFGIAVQDFETGWMRCFWVGPVLFVWHKPDCKGVPDE